MLITNADGPRIQRAWRTLLEGDSLQLSKGRGFGLHVAPPPYAGRHAPLLWLTEEGYPDDVFLVPGQHHVLRSDGLVVASAWGALNLRVLTAARRHVSRHEADPLRPERWHGPASVPCMRR